ncbi:MAG: hypothetical protein ACM3JB_19530 [Acidobacteriaceae bacterium]
MPTLDDVYRKFGEVSEAAQLLETGLGNMLIWFAGIEEGLISETLDPVNPKRAAEMVNEINRQTLGQLIRNTKRHTAELEKLEPMLEYALEERNRLTHHFYRHHNFRRNSDEGRAIMLKDLEVIHDVLIEAFKAITLLDGIDLDAVSDSADSGGQGPQIHLPL